MNSVSPFISLRGFAIPYGQVESCGGRREFVTAATFQNPLARIRQAFLNFGYHDADAICTPVTFFSCPYGLAFSASVSDEIWREIRGYLVGTYQFCSVQMDERQAFYERAPDGRCAVHIREASVEHVTITDRPIYSGTGIWPAPGVLFCDLPPRLAALNAKFERGRRVALAREKGRVLR